MARQYYLLDDEEKRVGPFLGRQVVARLRDGETKPEQLAWYKDIEGGWTPVGELAEFVNVEEIIEEEESKEEGEADSEKSGQFEKGEVVAGLEMGLPPARPWQRLAARVVDFAMFSTLLLTIMDKASITVLSDSWPMVQMASLFGVILIEAGMLMLTGTTPGKGLLGIHVRRGSDGKRLDLSSALGRTVLVWILGMGFGQPILMPFTMGITYFFLRRDGVTLWDRKRDVRLMSGGSTAFRLVVAGLLVASWMMLSGLMGMEMVVEGIRTGEVDAPAWYRSMLEEQGWDLTPIGEAAEEFPMEE